MALSRYIVIWSSPSSTDIRCRMAERVALICITKGCLGCKIHNRLCIIVCVNYVVNGNENAIVLCLWVTSDYNAVERDNRNPWRRRRNDDSLHQRLCRPNMPLLFIKYFVIATLVRMREEVKTYSRPVARKRAGSKETGKRSNPPLLFSRLLRPECPPCGWLACTY